jgi:hypothetical protein
MPNFAIFSYIVAWTNFINLDTYKSFEIYTQGQRKAKFDFGLMPLFILAGIGSIYVLWIHSTIFLKGFVHLPHKYLYVSK